MRKNLLRTLLAVVIMAATLNIVGGSTDGPLSTKKSFTVTDIPAKSTAVNPGIDFAKMSLYFVPNTGQVNEQARFYAKASTYTLWMTREGLIFDTVKKTGADTGAYSRDVSRLVFLGANKKPEMTAVDQTRHRVNYFKGKDKTQWHTGIATSRAVLYKDLYRNINLKVYGIEKQIEYDWVVEPKGNPSDIRFQYQDALDTRIDASGDLVIKTTAGEFVHKKPYSYQVIDGDKKEVKAVFKKIGKHTYAFDIGSYNNEQRLIIDPVILMYSTYFGTNYSSINEYFSTFTSDRNGLVYLVGATINPDFPMQNPFDNTFGTVHLDGFISVIDTRLSGGDSLIYSTFLGGNGVDAIDDVAVDSAGNIYVTGSTMSGYDPDPFPVTDGSSTVGDYDIFACKINPYVMSSAQLEYSTLFGGLHRESSSRIAVDDSDNIYVAGYTSSSDFPVTALSAYQTVKNGNNDFFVTHIRAPFGIQYATYLGGSTGVEEAEGDVRDIALGKNNNLFLVGKSSCDNFPVTGGALKTGHDNQDGFIAVVNTAAAGDNSLVYSSFFGGTEDEDIKGIHVRQENNDDAVYITGETDSDPASYSFPITAGTYQADRAGGKDAFLTKFSFNGSQLSLLYSSYLGGAVHDECGNSVSVDNNGIVYIAGETRSTDFPSINAYQASLSGTSDGFVSMLNLSGGPQGLILSTYLGGSSSENAYLVGWTDMGELVVTGATQSNNFPVLSAYKSNLDGARDAFVSRLDISTVAYINVAAPIGGETWYLGESETITWNAFGFTGSESVRLVLLQNGTVLGVIAENIAVSDGSYAWTVGRYDAVTAGAGTDYKIRVEIMGGVYYDQSESNFTIAPPSLAVTSPNGGEEWLPGSTHDITWTSDHVGGDVTIELYKNNVLDTTLGTAPAADGVFSWETPMTTTLGNDYQIRVHQGTVEDYSDADFSFIAQNPEERPDFNLDGHADILWRNNVTGENKVWVMNGTTLVEERSLNTMLNPDWDMAGTGDFNGDGHVDILWRSTSLGLNMFWAMEGFKKTATVWLDVLRDEEWDIKGTGDFNGDGKVDILWRNNTTGENKVWAMDGAVLIEEISLNGMLNPDWDMAGAGDFNGDGKVDVLWRSNTLGLNMTWAMDGTQKIATLWFNTLKNEDWDIVGAGDFNGDGHTDILWRNRVAGMGLNMFWALDGNLKKLSTEWLDTYNDPDWEIKNN